MSAEALADFVEARLADRAAEAPLVHTLGCDAHSPCPDGCCTMGTCDCGKPERILADVAAKRNLLALWQKIDSGVYSPDANQLADEMLEQLLAPYGKRAVWTRDAGWRIDG